MTCVCAVFPPKAYTQVCFLSLNSGEEGTFQCFADNRVGTSVSDKVTVVKAYLKEPTYTYVQVRHGIKLQYLAN